MKNLDVITFGEPMAMFYANEVKPLHLVKSFSRALAGAESNVACGLARLDLHVGYMTKLGNDSFGKFIMEELYKEKVDTMGIRFTSEKATGMLIKSKVVEGDPEVEYFRKNSAASTLNVDDLSEEYFGQAKHLHVTGIPSALSSGCHEFSLAAMRYMKQEGKTISFDPNLRLKLWKDKQTMIKEINQLACLADLFLPGMSEAEILTGLSTPEEVADFYISKGVKTVIIKLGAKGAYFKKDSEEGYINGFAVEEVVDTVGAGDGFAVGVISGLLDGKTIQEAVIRGNAIGALQVMSPGDMDGMPTRSKLDEFIEKQHKVHNS
ncbi:sugar kinase [Peribacillus sp. FSL H8-0477]|uniref:sugar kinase n=1 Tax=Peribacillus sp. FSL H8-0477 TaxID=2921388 RepID=UPI0030FAD74E